jgi:hypothetical protein
MKLMSDQEQLLRHMIQQKQVEIRMLERELAELLSEEVPQPICVGCFGKVEMVNPKNGLCLPCDFDENGPKQ